MNNTKQFIVKLGTEVLLSKKRWTDDRRLSQRVFNQVASQVVEIQNLDIGVTIVSSGAIQAGREKIGKLANLVMRPEGITLGKPELAGIGARYLLDMWGKAFEKCNREIAQEWVTFGNWNNEGERQSIKSGILSYQSQRVIPIVNENDVVSDNEIRLMEKGLSENDRLTRMIAELLNADMVLFLTKSGGVYEKDPTINPGARRYAEIDVKTARELAEASNIASESGTGGIGAKLREAAICAEMGMRVAIAGMKPNTIYKFAAGEPVGTMIGKTVRLRS